MVQVKVIFWCWTFYHIALFSVDMTSAQSTVSEQLNQIMSILHVIHSRSSSFRSDMNSLEMRLNALAYNQTTALHPLLQSVLHTKNNLDFMLTKIGIVETLLRQLDSQRQKSLVETAGMPTNAQENVKTLPDLQRILQLLNQNVQSLQAQQSHCVGSGLNFDSLKTVIQSLLAGLEHKLDRQIYNVTTNQQTILHDLRMFNSRTNSHRSEQSSQTRVSSNRDPVKIIQDGTSAGNQMLDQRLERIETMLRTVCLPPVETPASYSQPDPKQVSLEFTANQPKHHPGPQTKTRYNPSGIDIISPPNPLEDVEVGRKLKQSPNSDRSYLKSRPIDCEDLYRLGFRKTGIYEAYMEQYGQALPILCDMDTSGGGWTVILRRNNSRRPQITFDRPWSTYKNGFGDLNSEFWLGNRFVHSLTYLDSMVLRVDIKDHLGRHSYAEYDRFVVHSESTKYRLTLGGFRGGNLEDEFSSHNGSYFSTSEEDNDRHPGRNCAETFFGGWWYDNCFRVYLTGPHVFPLDSNAIQGIYWGFRFPGNKRLQAAEMKIRPADFRSSLNPT